MVEDLEDRLCGLECVDQTPLAITDSRVSINLTQRKNEIAKQIGRSCLLLKMGFSKIRSNPTSY